MYGKGHLSSTTSSNCLLCNKSTSSYVEMSDYNENGYRKKGCSITIPICEEHYKDIEGDILSSYAKFLNSTFKKLYKLKKEV